MTLKQLTAATLLGLFSAAASAVPFMTMDPRSLGMGGTGVSAATSASASLYNPALLAAAHQKEDFNLELPVIAYRISDPSDLRTALEDFNNSDYFTKYETARSNLDPLNPSTSSIQAFQDASRDLLNGLQTLSGKPVEADGSFNAVISFPSRTTGIALTIGGWASLGAIAELTASDRSTLEALINTPNSGFNAAFINSILSGAQYTSYTRIQGIATYEVGISLAREFTLFNREVAMGITPKAVQASTIDIQYVANDLDNAETNIDQGRQDSTGFTMDFGIARDYGNGWKTGLVIKNLIPQSYDTATGDKIEVNPIARAGLSYHTDRATLAVDLDLTENDPTGLGGKSQYASVGAELDAWLLLVRLGYRYNIANPDTSITTVGLGLNLLGLHVDVAAGISNNEEAYSAQFGFRF